MELLIYLQALHLAFNLIFITIINILEHITSLNFSKTMCTLIKID